MNINVLRERLEESTHEASFDHPRGRRQAVTVLLRWLAPALALGWSALAAGADAPPAPWRDRPFYPGLYMSAGYERDSRDSVFDQKGQRAASAMPTTGGDTSFPESQLQLQFSWYFPLFESWGIPYVSDHLFTSRIRLGYQDTRTDGSLNGFIATNPDVAPQTSGGGAGLEDLSVEWGSFIVGGRNWRNGATMDDRFSMLALAGLTLPVGRYDRQVPISPGDNALAWHARLGLQWQPWQGGSLDGGFAYHWHARNAEPAFGGLAPSRQGDDLTFDLSFTQKLLPHLHASAFAGGRDGGANEYTDLAYAPNAPPLPAPLPGGSSRNIPVAGAYRDAGTRLLSAGASLHWFITQNWLASLSYTRPLSGRSGQFVLPFDQEQCLPGAASGALTCSTSAGPSRLQDGAGSARSYASDSWALGLTYKFNERELFACTGCD